MPRRSPPFRLGEREEPLRRIEDTGHGQPGRHGSAHRGIRRSRRRCRSRAPPGDRRPVAAVERADIDDGYFGEVRFCHDSPSVPLPELTGRPTPLSMPKPPHRGGKAHRFRYEGRPCTMPRLQNFLRLDVLRFAISCRKSPRRPLRGLLCLRHRHRHLGGQHSARRRPHRPRYRHRRLRASRGRGCRHRLHAHWRPCRRPIGFTHSRNRGASSMPSPSRPGAGAEPPGPVSLPQRSSASAWGSSRSR